MISISLSWFFHIVILLSGFLLFQIELIVAKILLPNFGGSYLVWGACVVFFQAALLLGYLYSHFVLQRFGIDRYRYFHILLLCLPVLSFPGRPIAMVFEPLQIPIALDVFWKLLYTVGPVFFVLSTTSVVLQSWLAASTLKEKTNPYTLYAMSNIGSFTGLFTYPFFFETAFDLKTQLDIWRVFYFALLVGHLIILRTIKTRPVIIERKEKITHVPPKELWLWLLFGAAGVMLFLSTTNILTYEITPFPLLWIIPLGIYLLSWVLNFKQHPWCPAWINKHIHLTIGFSIFLFFSSYRSVFPFLVYVISYSLILFATCMCCQSMLYKSKPADNQNLTTFYAMISLGGFLGGVIVNWIIPVLFVNMMEFLISLIILAFALKLRAPGREKISWPQIRFMIYPVLLMLIWPLKFMNYNVFGLALLLVGIGFIFSEFEKKMKALIFCLLIFIFAMPFLESAWGNTYTTYEKRNYYGIYKVFNDQGIRYLMHGQTTQGAQLLQKEKQMEPILYYHPKSPAGEIFKGQDFNFKDVAIIGLGTGAMAASLPNAKTIDFFEIDPDMYFIAKKYFTFLDKTPSQKRFIFGDGRMTLSKMTDQHYDLLILDVFSGDSIPVHLLTTEAISEYRKHLKKDGIILFHVTNRYIDVVPIVFTNARMVGAAACFKANRTSTRIAYPTKWMIITWDEGRFKTLIKKMGWEAFKFEKVCPWTDQYSNVLSMVKFRDILDQVKDFRPFRW